MKTPTTMNQLKSDIQILTVLIITENYMCVYRNYSSFSKVNRVLVIFRVIIVSLIYISASAYGVYTTFSNLFYENTMLCIYKTVHTFLTTTITIFSFFIGVRQSKIFQKVILKLDQVHRSCKTGKEYNKELNEFTIKSIINSAIILFTTFIIFIAILVNTGDQIRGSSLGKYILVGWITALTMWRELHFFVELFCFNTLIKIITFALKHIETSLMESLTNVSTDDCDDLGGTHIDYEQLRKSLKMAMPTFIRLKDCSDDLRNCFGVQVVFSLFNLSLFYIFLSYRAITLVTSGTHEYKGGQLRPSHITTIFQLLNYMGSIVATLYSGQVAHNAMDDLSRSVATLYNKLLTMSTPDAVELRKTMKNFQRQITIKPVAVKVWSMLPMRMALLLQILSTIISYTIITLQFNHVV